MLYLHQTPETRGFTAQKVQNCAVPIIHCRLVAVVNNTSLRFWAVLAALLQIWCMFWKIVCVYIYLNIYTLYIIHYTLCMCIYIYVHVHVHVYVYVYVHVYVFVNIYIYTYVCK